MDDGTIIEISDEEDSIFNENNSDNSLTRDEEYFYEYEEVLNEETFAVEFQRVKKKRIKIDESEIDVERKRKRFQTTDGSITNPEIVNFL